MGAAHLTPNVDESYSKCQRPALNFALKSSKQHAGCCRPSPASNNPPSRRRTMLVHGHPANCKHIPVPAVVLPKGRMIQIPKDLLIKLKHRYTIIKKPSFIHLVPHTLSPKQIKSNKHDFRRSWVTRSGHLWTLKNKGIANFRVHLVRVSTVRWYTDCRRPQCRRVVTVNNASDIGGTKGRNASCIVMMGSSESEQDTTYAGLRARRPPHRCTTGRASQLVLCYSQQLI